MGRVQKNRVLFTCDTDGCENTKEVLESSYKRTKKHYCSKACYLSNKTRHNHGKYITYECEYCGEEQCQLATLYITRKGHYCNTECKKAHTAELLEARSPKKDRADKDMSFGERWSKMMKDLHG